MEGRGGLDEVRCPSCGEWFSVPVPPPTECPARLDYDCEVCCRPMVVVVDEEGRAEALGTDDAYSV
ncbi:MAG: CPXCG motif-containing cysteine-rich protein [Akkermansiaceae bacterium]|nr:CPXCG motif-containing cysteine-rich protein [Akkermansiaceae bacterium]